MPSKPSPQRGISENSFLWSVFYISHGVERQNLDLLGKTCVFWEKNPIILVGTYIATEWLLKCFPGINLPLFHSLFSFVSLERILTIPGNTELMATKNPGVEVTPTVQS